VILRRLRSRFGPAASRVSIRAELPFYLRALAVIVLAACALALAGWIYDTGRRFAGFHQEESAKELVGLHERVAQLEEELAEVSKVASSSDSRLRIESTTQDLLSKQLKVLEDENSRLKADLAMFENLAGGEVGGGPLVISRLQVVASPEPGQYRYRLLVAQKSDKKERDFKGSLQLMATVQRGTETVMIRFPSGDPADAARFAVTFRYFRRLEGSFNLPAGVKLVRVEARLIENGSIKASHILNL